MKGIPSLLRLAEHQAMSRISLHGEVIDLGGDKGSDYLEYFKGKFETTTLNLNDQVRPDILHDLEKPLPLTDGSYDCALLINVLEHIFEYRQLIEEAVRVMKKEGTVVVVVPFLFPVHPSPDDFHRFTASTLRKEFERLGLSNILLQALGSGVFSARFLMLDRLLPRPLRFINFYTFRYLSQAADMAWTKVARITGKKYKPEEYALGYCVSATK